jgi:hypothetical protein
MIENKKIPKLYADGNSGPGLRLAQTCGIIKPIDVIYSAWNRGDSSSMLQDHSFFSTTYLFSLVE